MNDKSEEALKRIEQQLDDALIERLTLHALHKLERRYWQGVLGGEVPGGDQAMDFVETAIQKTLRAASGAKAGRNWDYEAQPDLFEHLKSVIDSDINHAAESWENRNFRSEAALTITTEDGQKVGMMGLIPTRMPNPGEACSAAEQERAREKVLFAFIDFIADDIELQKVMELLFDGVIKPKNQAERIGISPKQMYVLTQRMSRRTAEFRQKNTKLLSRGRNACLTIKKNQKLPTFFRHFMNWCKRLRRIWLPSRWRRFARN